MTRVGPRGDHDVPTLALPDLASRALGATVMHATDELYGAANHLISPGPATHDPTTFDLRGKVYDGWETRRRRGPGVDQAVVRLGVPGVVRAVVVDTAHFRGNYPPAASIETATLLGHPGVEEVLAADWVPTVERTRLAGDSANVLAVPASSPDRLVTHLRLTIYPDGGVARLRVHGEVVPDPRRLGGRVDLAALVHGARVRDCSNDFYSRPENVLMPGRAQVMSDGWETARRRDGGNDWLTVALAAPGVLHQVVVDTTRFVGNAPGWVRLSDADSGAELLARTAVVPDTEHRFRVRSATTVRVVRLDIYPDGGISRLRLLGQVPPEEHRPLARQWLDLLPAPVAAGVDPEDLFA